MHRILRSSFLIGAAVFLGLASVARPVSAATCVITANTTVDQSYVDSNSCDAINIIGGAGITVTWSGSIDLQGAGMVSVGSGTAIFDGALTLGATDDLTVTSTGIITHAAENPVGVQISAKDVTVTGSIQANAKGCAAGADGGTVANQDGSGPDLDTGVCTKQTSGYGTQVDGGASHGGMGGVGFFGSVSKAIYGDQMAPTLLGSGGGGGPNGGEIGGDGGGRIQIFASGTLTVNGSVSANGESRAGGGARGGGGSGGSLYLKAGTLAGSGTITANGGQGDTNSGGGGGGRIAIYYTSMGVFTLSNVTASAGLGGASFVDGGVGRPGTVYLLNRYTDDGVGTITVKDSFDFRADKDYVRDGFTVVSGTQLVCNSGTSGDIALNATALTFGWFTWTCAAQVPTITVSSTQAFSFTSSTLSFTTVSSTNLFANGALTFTTSSLSFANVYRIESPTSALVAFSPQTSLSLVSSTIVGNVSSTLASLSVDSVSSISANYKGCSGGGDFSSPPKDGYGPSLVTGVCTNATSGYGKVTDGGAAHGGAGGRAHHADNPQATTYGSASRPAFLGSGGGGGDNGDEKGGRGGGVILLDISGSAVVNGALSVNGEQYPGSNRSGGGSGGSLFLQSASIAGSGSLRALGGAGLTLSGGGGGGRVAVLFSGGATTTLTMASTGGARGSGDGSHAAGSDGTVYTLQTNVSPDFPTGLGPETLVNGSTTGTTTPTLSFTLSDPDGADTVKYQIQIDDTADFSSPVIDYTSAFAAQGARTFQVGQAAGSGSYVIGDGAVLTDGAYYWRVRTMDAGATASSYAVAGAGAIAFYVDSAPRYLSFLSSIGSGLESVTATSIRIVLNTTHFQDVTTNYAIVTASTTASGAGVDYTFVAGTATILAGETSTTISLVVVDDAIDEPSETVVVELSSPVFATIGSNTSTVYTILDNDTAGVDVTPTTRALSEGGASSTYTIVLASQPTSTVQIVIAPPADLTVSTTTLNFTSTTWNVPQTVTVNAYQDTLQEGAHVAVITHTASVPSGSAFGYEAVSISSLTATIADDEVASLSSSLDQSSLQEGTAATYTVVLGTAPTTSVQVLLSAGEGLGLSASTVTFTADNWTVPQTVLVTALNDVDFTGSRTSTITQSVSTTASGYVSLTLPVVSVQITDDEQGGGGGGAGAGVGAGSVSPISFVPVAPVVVQPPAVVVNQPIIVVSDTPIPATQPIVSSDTSRPIVTILNPSDVRLLIEATSRSRDIPSEAKYGRFLAQDAKEFKVPLSDEERIELANFVTYGISEVTRALGAGERRAIVRDRIQTLGTADISPGDLERMARGIIPLARNLKIERQQVARAQTTFRTIFGADPVFSDSVQNLAWNTLMYRIRFPRDLEKEAEGIREFRALFGKNPSDPFQWSVVRVLGYLR